MFVLILRTIERVRERLVSEFTQSQPRNTPCTSIDLAGRICNVCKGVSENYLQEKTSRVRSQWALLVFLKNNYLMDYGQANIENCTRLNSKRNKHVEPYIAIRGSNADPKDFQMATLLCSTIFYCICVCMRPSSHTCSKRAIANVRVYVC